MDNTEKARELISKHLYLHGGDGLGIADGDVYSAVLDAVSEALTIPVVVAMLPSDDEIETAAKEEADRLHQFGNDAEWYARSLGFIDGAEFVKDKVSGN